MALSDRSVLAVAGQVGLSNVGDDTRLDLIDRQEGEDRLRRMLARIALLLLAVLLLVNVGRFIHFARFALGYPYDLDYGEGIVWQQMRNIVAGHGYRPIGVFPAIVYHYPPIYHLTVAATAMVTGMDQLIAGRLVSLASLLVSMVLIGRLAPLCLAPAEGRKVRLAVGVTSALCMLSTPEVVYWSVMMRVDLLAMALSFAGLLFAIGAARRPLLVIGAAICFTLAIYTKQTSIAAPAAAFLGLWIVRRKSAIVLLVLCLAIGLAALAGLSAVTSGGFLRHIVVYNINRIDLGRAPQFLRYESRQLPFLIAAALGAAMTWTRLRGGGQMALRSRFAADPDLVAPAIMLLFLIGKALMLPAILKSGAAANYLVEWTCIVSVFVGVSLAPVYGFVIGSRNRLPILILALTIIDLPLQLASQSDITPSDQAVRRQVAMLDSVVARIRASDRPVISDDMVLIIRAGRPVLWEPAIVAELAHGGRYDDAAFVRLVQRQIFGFFFTQGDRGSSPFDERYDPAVAEAIARYYPVKKEVDGEILHLPR